MPNSGGHRHPRSDTEIVGSDQTEFSGPVNIQLPKFDDGKSTRFNIPTPVAATDDTYVEITVNVREDTVAVHGVKTDGGAEVEAPGMTQEKRSSFRLSVVRTDSSRIGQVSQELKRLASITKWPSLQRRFDWIESAAEKRFDEMTATTDGLLSRSQLGKCLGRKKEWEKLDGVLFDAFCRRRNITGGSLNKTQFKEFLDQISDQSFDAQVQLFFDVVDKDANGRITEDELSEAIRLSALVNKLSNIEKQADGYAALIMENLDSEKQGYIKIADLQRLLTQAVNDKSRNLGQQPMPTHDCNPLVRWYRHLKHFLLENWQRVWVMALWLGAMAGLFGYKYVEYKNHAAYEVMGHCVCMAKAAGETLKLNMALILLPACRNTITWLRNATKLGGVLPFDDNINFHMVVATAVGIGVGIHAIYHMSCDFPKLLEASPEKYTPMVQYFGNQPESYWFFVKGVEGVTGIIMVVLMVVAFTLATPWLRRKDPKCPSFLKNRFVEKLTGFNAFWYSHHLFVVVYALLILHSVKLYLSCEKTIWMYLAVPILIYAGERLTRLFRSAINPVEILNVAIHRDALALYMSKPEGFKYRSGQYIFVKCPAISPFEWHPFSITSAPDDDCLNVHIKALGDWTKELKKICEPPAEGKGGLGADYLRGRPAYIPKVMIDGPYGAPAQDYKKYEVVLLIGLGIGATPMISIVKDIVNNMKTVDGKAEISSTNFRTRKAYFYWSTRDQHSFAWFREIMNKIADMDENGAIEMHNHCTSIKEKGNVWSALIAMLQSLNHAKNGVDVVSGTRVKSYFGRPDWRRVYQSVADNHCNARVGVFYCGEALLIKKLKQLALEFSEQTTTRFEFHKENF